MPTCPNCSFKLVLLPHRLKYKCALCSKLYPQKEIEDKSFRELNKRERKLDREKLEKELKKLQEGKLRKKQLRKIEKIKKEIRVLFNGHRARNLTIEQKRKNKQKSNRKYNDKNPGKYREMKRRYLNKNREHIYNYLKQWRRNNLSESRIRQRVCHWRRKQRLLADQYLKFSNEKASSIKFYPFPLTFALCELLKK